MLDASANLGGAIRIGTTPLGGFPLRSFAFGDGRTAFGAGLGKTEPGLLAGAFGGQHAHNLGNDLASFLDQDRIADLNIQAADLIFVMQGGALDRGSSEKNRLQLSNGGQLARSTNLD